MKKTILATSLFLALNVVSAGNAKASDEVKTAKESKNELIGFSSGLVAGAAVGGPVGAIVGGIFGIFIADDVNDEDKKNAQRQALNQAEYALSKQENKIIALQSDLEKLHQAKSIQLANFKEAQTKQILEVLPKLETNIQFKTASFIVEEEYTSQLDKLASLLNAYPELTVSVNGFADQRGDSHYNKVLSEQRAKAIAEYLTAKNVQASQIDYTGFGETQPQLNAQMTPSAEEYFFDRRATLKINPSQQNMTAAK
ncbi:sortase-associated OmpA-like protein PdsO [Agaribacter flavus]|uniref:Sortase-associated OmpA-like protein PdsO n=1 Tax=Agaribacter flavus TaxID=1902781 RepID=A0ABV7FPE2_9ALTE